MKAVVGLLVLFVTGPTRAEPGLVEVTVSNVRSGSGHVLVAICDRATFLQPTCRYHGRVQATPGTVVVDISGVPPGVYAAQAFLDENDNGKIDRNFFGLPTEGIGFSNDAPMRFGPPSFDAAAVSLGPDGGVLKLALRYYD